MGEWQPIETAPRDKTEILVFVPDTEEQFVAFWNPEVGGWQFARTPLDGYIYTRGAEHWQPLPEPPK